MLIYHGTSALAVAAILKNGIVPRALHGRSNWENCPSNEQMVYLTSTYPLYFAVCATEKEDEKFAVFEIDFRRLKTAKLYPDEDFVAQVLYQNEKTRPNVDLETFTQFVRRDIDRWRTKWRGSLDKMGTCAYQGTIPSDAILRYAEIDRPVRPELVFEMMQPSIMPINFAIKGLYYQKFVRWVFGDESELPQLEEAKGWLSHPESDERFKASIRQRVDFWTEQSSNRKGIEVHDLVLHPS